MLGFDASMEVAQVGVVAHGNECAFHQRGMDDFVAALGDASARHNYRYKKIMSEIDRRTLPPTKGQKKPE